MVFSSGKWGIFPPIPNGFSVPGHTEGLSYRWLSPWPRSSVCVVRGPQGLDSGFYTTTSSFTGADDKDRSLLRRTMVRSYSTRDLQSMCSICRTATKVRYANPTVCLKSVLLNFFFINMKKNLVNLLLLYREWRKRNIRLFKKIACLHFSLQSRTFTV